MTDFVPDPFTRLLSNSASGMLILLGNPKPPPIFMSVNRFPAQVTNRDLPQSKERPKGKNWILIGGQRSRQPFRDTQIPWFGFSERP